MAKFLNRKNIKIDLITINPKIARINKVAGYVELINYKELFNSVYVADKYTLNGKNDKKYFEDISEKNVGLCIGWQRLIPGYILDKFKIGIHGMHGSTRNLPFGKGRSPMNWSLIENRSFFYTNLFKYLDGVDNGPIIDTEVFSILDSDNAESLHYKNTLAMCSIIERNFENFFNNTIKYVKQDEKCGESFYPKREPKDGIIDWDDDIFNIDRLIRAVSPPFAGALCYYEDCEFKIKRASIFYTDLEKHPFRKNINGQILDIFPNNKFLVRCNGGVLLVHEFSEVKLKVGAILEKKESPFKKFPRNDYGFFDN